MKTENKKVNISLLFESAKTRKYNEVKNAMKKYCMKVDTTDMNDLQEIHHNIKQHFELSSKDSLNDLNFFKNTIIELQKIAEQKKSSTS